MSIDADAMKPPQLKLCLVSQVTNLAKYLLLKDKFTAVPNQRTLNCRNPLLKSVSSHYRSKQCREMDSNEQESAESET